jgi:hypothetical protein
VSGTAIDDIFGFIFGASPPPVSLVLRVLGLDAIPASHEEIKSAFRARILQVHPDIVGEKAHSEYTSELVWAREVLLRKVADVTANGVAGVNIVSRHEKQVCKVCAGERLHPRTGKPYLILSEAYGRRLRWIGYCEACAYDAERARQRELRAMVRANRRCKVCGRVFTPQRSDGLYCKPGCRQAAYRNRKVTP